METDNKEKQNSTTNVDEIISDFAEAWRTLNSNLIIKHLSKEFIYDSQWVFSSLDYEGYVDYIIGKFNTIKEHNCGPIVKIVDDNTFGSNKMLALKQGNNVCYYRIKVKDGQVIKGDLCMF